MHPSFDFDQRPFLVIWETTQACDLACVHCRASADPLRHPLELTTEEGVDLLEEIKRFGDPLMIFTGGDPLKRPDLFELLDHSVRLGLRTTVSPSPTPLLIAAAIATFKGLGVARMSISVDGHDAASHDNFRQVPGSFARAMSADATVQALTPSPPRPLHLPMKARSLLRWSSWIALSSLARPASSATRCASVSRIARPHSRSSGSRADAPTRRADGTAS